MVAGVCGLFGVSGGREPVRATFWLLEGPDSLARQSGREFDGTGLGTFDEHGCPVVSEQPLAACEDMEFAQEAREVSSRTFVAHVRYASTGGVSPENTHPFEQRNRLFAHNGVIGDPERIEPELGDFAKLVRGETDSERVLRADHQGDRARWRRGRRVHPRDVLDRRQPAGVRAQRDLDHRRRSVGAPVPDVHELFVLERAARGPTGQRHLGHPSARGSMRVRAGDLASRRAVIVASERMDEDPGWRALESGELLQVDPDLVVMITGPLDRAPARQLTLADLGSKAAASQARAQGR